MNAPTSPLGAEHARSCLEWLLELSWELTTEVHYVTPSEYAEEHRKLPATAPIPGAYSYAHVPYLREIIDNFDPRSQVRTVSWCKGAQIAATVGGAENLILYAIGRLRSTPVLYLTATDEMAKERMESSFLPMIDESGMADLIRSHDRKNGHKSGRTKDKLEWEGGGLLYLRGARSAAKLSSISVGLVLCDEVDRYPQATADGDPLDLARARASAYNGGKLFAFSTPAMKGTSRIWPLYEQGDKRKYFVPCRNPECGLLQHLEWNKKDEKGQPYGIVYELDASGDLVPGSVRYRCRGCGHLHTETDKPYLLGEGRWEPTATPRDPTHRSYHLSGLYSPFFSWENIVREWLQVWDVKANKVRSREGLQVFYNNRLGMPFEEATHRLTPQVVSGLCLPEYDSGVVPNSYATEQGAPIEVLTAAVDVGGSKLWCATYGHTARGQMYLIDYRTWESDTPQGTHNVNDPVWVQLRAFLEGSTFSSRDGRQYMIQLALIDSGDGSNSDTVYEFCGRPSEVPTFPLKGRSTTGDYSQIKEFSTFETRFGVQGYLLNVSRYKDRLSAHMGTRWDRHDVMPEGYLALPGNLPSEAIKELSTEYKRKDKRGVPMWYRPHGAPNELWDLSVYNMAALEILAFLYWAPRPEERWPLIEDVVPGYASTPGRVDWGIWWQTCARGLFWKVAT